MSDTTLPRTGRIEVHDTHVAVWEDADGADDVRLRVEPALREVWMQVRAHLEGRGWLLTSDPDWDRIVERPWKKRMKKAEREQHAAYVTKARELYRVGRKGDLELAGETSGIVLKLEFFQNVANVENRNGGRHDFDKLVRMPRDLRLRCVVEMVAAIRFLQGLGYRLGKDLCEPLAGAVIRIAEGRQEEGLSPLERFDRGWTPTRFTRGPDGWPLPVDTSGHGQPCRDRAGVGLSPGLERCVYDHHKRLVQGRVYPNMNGMWVVRDPSGGHLANVSSGELFAAADQTPRRQPLRADRQIGLLRRKLDDATREKNDGRARFLRRTLAKLGADVAEPRYYVLSLAHSKEKDRILTWWGPNDCGYVYRLEHAGKYLASQIAGHPSHYDDGDQTRAGPVELVERVAVTVAEVDERCRELDRGVRPGERVVEYARLAALRRPYREVAKGPVSTPVRCETHEEFAAAFGEPPAAQVPA